MTINKHVKPASLSVDINLMPINQCERWLEQDVLTTMYHNFIKKEWIKTNFMQKIYFLLNFQQPSVRLVCLFKGT